MAWLLDRPGPWREAAAWSGPVPWLAGERVTVQMGASRGRPTQFTIVHGWGATTSPIDSLETETTKAQDWIGFLLFALAPLAGSVVFAMRNLRLARVDWRGATRIAVFVFVMNVFEAVFSTRLAEDGLLNALFYVTEGRALGHALMHAMQMWFAYVALEPYVRRLWPRMLVSWARLVSGRVRDPLVGRDVLVGVTAGSLLSGLALLAQFLSARSGITRVPSLISDGVLTAVASLPNTACLLSYAGSICVLGVLTGLVVLLLARLLLRRTWAAIVVTIAISTLLGVDVGANGWPVTIANTVVGALSILLLMRFGLLAACAAGLAQLVISGNAASLDLSSWYADRALVPMLVLAGLLVYGATTALAGKPILGDPLKETAGR